MAKTHKQAAAPDLPLMPRVGDKVKPGRQDGQEVDLHVPGTILQRFRVRTDTLTYVDRKTPAKTSNPFTQPEPTFDAGKVIERISTVQRENLQRLDDDIEILAKYLKTEGVPKAAIFVLENMSNEQQEGWKKAIEHIQELLEE